MADEQDIKKQEETATAAQAPAQSEPAASADRPANAEGAKSAQAPAGQRPARPAGGRGRAPGQTRAYSAGGSDDRRDRGKSKGGGGRGRGRGRKPDQRAEREFDQQILELARVTRVTKGGKRMRFRVTMIIGDRKGRVGYGIAKGLDVQGSVQKAVNQAKKRLITVPLSNETIPHPVRVKFSGAEIVLKPAPKGTGIKAGGAVRVVMEFAGVPNVTGKILGSGSKINNTKATIKALMSLMSAPAKPAQAKADQKDPAPAQA